MHVPFNYFRPLLCLFCLVLLTGCPARVPLREGTPPLQTGMVEDLRVFPQDLGVYARIVGNDTVLLSPTEQVLQDARFNRIFFKSWEMTTAGVKPRDFKAPFAKAKGYHGAAAWTQAEWNAMARNADVGNYPSRAEPAITIRRTNLREMPTLEARYSKPTPDPALNPFDYFQYSLLPAGFPLFITHTTRDRVWHYAENPIAAGWVLAADVALADPGFIGQYRNGRYAALIRDGVSIVSERGEPLGQEHIGAVFPVAATKGGRILALIPQRDGTGRAVSAKAWLSDGDAVVKPLPALPKLMAAVGNQMVAQPYGWGGSAGYRDCSSTTRDLFTPFGIWLPRNSSAQARSGRYESLEGLAPAAKEAAVLSSGVPFMTLLWMRGHVGLYVGNYKKRAAFFHNVWGVRVKDGPDDDGRHVIGRCVITSLEPGKELPNAAPASALVNRISGMSTLPAPRNN